MTQWNKYGWVILWLGILGILILRCSWIDHSATMKWGYVNAGAVNPYYGVMRPLGYRLLMPVLLNLAGVIPKPGNALIPVLFTSGMCMAYYAFLRMLRFSIFLSSFGALFLACCGGITDLLKEFGINNADASCHLLILLSFCAMIKKQDALFSALTMLGVFNREWALVILPVWYIYNFGFSIAKNPVYRLIRVSLPSLAVYFLVRNLYFPNTALGVLGTDLADLLPKSETTTLQYYFSEASNLEWSTLISRFCSLQLLAYGLLGLLPYAVFGFKSAPAEWKRVFLLYSPLCMMQLLAATDIWRLAFYLFPVLITLYLYWIQSLESRFSLLHRRLILFLSAGGYLLIEKLVISCLQGIFNPIS